MTRWSHSAPVAAAKPHSYLTKTTQCQNPLPMGHVIQIDEETLLGEIQRRLLNEFPSVSPRVVDILIRAEHARIEGSPIRDFIPLFVEKRARRDLRARPN